MIAIVSTYRDRRAQLAWYMSRVDLYDVAVDQAIEAGRPEPDAGNHYSFVPGFAATLANVHAWEDWRVIESAAGIDSVESLGVANGDELQAILTALRAEFVHNLQVDPLQARYDTEDGDGLMVIEAPADVAPALSFDSPGVYRDQTGELRFYSFLD